MLIMDAGLLGQFCRLNNFMTNTPSPQTPRQSLQQVQREKNWDLTTVLAYECGQKSRDAEIQELVEALREISSFCTGRVGQVFDTVTIKDMADQVLAKHSQK